MRHHAYLHAVLQLRDPIHAGDKLFGGLATRTGRGPAEHERTIRLAAVVHGEIETKRRRRVAAQHIQLDRRRPDGDGVAILDRDVAARQPLVIGIGRARQRVPVRLAHCHPYAGELLDARRTRRVIEMVVGEDDVLDVRGIETELPDGFEGMLLVRAFQRVDQDESLGRRNQPRADISDAHVIQIVEDLERRQIL